MAKECIQDTVQQRLPWIEKDLMKLILEGHSQKVEDSFYLARLIISENGKQFLMDGLHRISAIISTGSFKDSCGRGSNLLENGMIICIHEHIYNIIEEQDGTIQFVICVKNWVHVTDDLPDFSENVADVNSLEVIKGHLQKSVSNVMRDTDSAIQFHGSQFDMNSHNLSTLVHLADHTFTSSESQQNNRSMETSCHFKKSAHNTQALSTVNIPVNVSSNCRLTTDISEVIPSVEPIKLSSTCIEALPRSTNTAGCISSQDSLNQSENILQNSQEFHLKYSSETTDSPESSFLKKSNSVKRQQNNKTCIDSVPEQSMSPSQLLEIMLQNTPQSEMLQNTPQNDANGKCDPEKAICSDTVETEAESLGVPESAVFSQSKVHVLQSPTFEDLFVSSDQKKSLSVIEGWNLHDTTALDSSFSQAFLLSPSTRNTDFSFGNHLSQPTLQVQAKKYSKNLPTCVPLSNPSVHEQMEDICLENIEKNDKDKLLLNQNCDEKSNIENESRNSSASLFSDTEHNSSSSVDNLKLCKQLNASRTTQQQNSSWTQSESNESDDSVQKESVSESNESDVLQKSCAVVMRNCDYVTNRQSHSSQIGIFQRDTVDWERLNGKSHLKASEKQDKYMSSKTEDSCETSIKTDKRKYTNIYQASSRDGMLGDETEDSRFLKATAGQPNADVSSEAAIMSSVLDLSSSDDIYMIAGHDIDSSENLVSSTDSIITPFHPSHMSTQTDQHVHRTSTNRDGSKYREIDQVSSSDGTTDQVSSTDGTLDNKTGSGNPKFLEATTGHTNADIYHLSTKTNRHFPEASTVTSLESKSLEQETNNKESKYGSNHNVGGSTNSLPYIKSYNKTNSFRSAPITGSELQDYTKTSNSQDISQINSVNWNARNRTRQDTYFDRYNCSSRDSFQPSNSISSASSKTTTTNTVLKMALKNVAAVINDTFMQANIVAKTINNKDLRVKTNVTDAINNDSQVLKSIRKGKCSSGSHSCMITSMTASHVLPASIQSLSYTLVLPSTEVEIIVPPSTEVGMIVSPSTEIGKIVSPSTEVEMIVPPSTEGGMIVPPSTEGGMIVSPYTEGGMIVSPSTEVGVMMSKTRKKRKRSLFSDHIYLSNIIGDTSDHSCFSKRSKRNLTSCDKDKKVPIKTHPTLARSSQRTSNVRSYKCNDFSVLRTPKAHFSVCVMEIGQHDQSVQEIKKLSDQSLHCRTKKKCFTRSRHKPLALLDNNVGSQKHFTAIKEIDKDWVEEIQNIENYVCSRTQRGASDRTPCNRDEEVNVSRTSRLVTLCNRDEEVNTDRTPGLVTPCNRDKEVNVGRTSRLITLCNRDEVNTGRKSGVVTLCKERMITEQFKSDDNINKMSSWQDNQQQEVSTEKFISSILDCETDDIPHESSLFRWAVSSNASDLNNVTPVLDSNPDHDIQESQEIPLTSLFTSATCESQGFVPSTSDNDNRKDDFTEASVGFELTFTQDNMDNSENTDSLCSSAKLNQSITSLLNYVCQGKFL